MTGARSRRSSRCQRALAATLAAALAAFAAATIATPAASAHGPGQNGCTAVPDSGRTFNFHAACDRHDLCYDQLWYGRGRWIPGIGWTGRLACDNLWLREMKDSCRARYPNRFDWRRGSCEGIAEGYYAGVRLRGGPYFDNPNLN
jgi:hypothetical protein